MSNLTFDESASWDVDFPVPETSVGPMFYREGNGSMEFCFEIRGGKDAPFAVIRPDRFLVEVPEYVLRRLAEVFQTHWTVEKLRVEFPPDHPSMAYLFSGVARGQGANVARWMATIRAAPHPLSEWICIWDETYWDGLRSFIMRFGDEARLFNQPFDHDKDDYADWYEVYRLLLEVAERPEGVSAEFRLSGERLPDVPAQAVRFRTEEVPGRRRLWLVYKSVLESLAAERP